MRLSGSSDGGSDGSGVGSKVGSCVVTVGTGLGSLATGLPSGSIRNIAAITIPTITTTAAPPPRIHGHGLFLPGGGPVGRPYPSAGICIVAPLGGPAAQCGPVPGGTGRLHGPVAPGAPAGGGAG